MTTAFHDVSFPLSIALRSIGGPHRQTDIYPLKSGYEQRVSRWQHSKRRYNAGVGVKNRADLLKLIDFFEARRGRYYAFRFQDMVDFSSSLSGQAITAFDQLLNPSEDNPSSFQLTKHYGLGEWQYHRPITKPRAETLIVGKNGVLVPPSEYDVDGLTGKLTFHTPPDENDVITAGFEFDVPVRFDSDELMIDLVSFEAGQIPDIPIIEVLDR